MNKRKLLALLLSAMILISILAACGGTETKNESPPPLENNATDSTDTTDTTPPATNTSPQQPGGQQPGGQQTEETDNAPPSTDNSGAPANINSKVPRDTFIVGTPAMNGDFIPGFGNSAYDKSIKVLTNGFYETYWETPDGQLALNPTVVKDEQISFDADGNKTYTFTIWDDLKWNNGETIYAKDYVATYLFFDSPEYAAVGAVFELEGIIGTFEYLEGDAEYYAGVKLIDDFTFSLTVSADELPYFWESAFVTTAPYGPICLKTYSPGNDIISDENGSRFVNDIAADCERIAAGERYAPTVTCGPYKFISFDGSTVTMQRNQFYKSDQTGNKPVFEWVIQKEVPTETDVDMVLSGDIDFRAGNVEGNKIEAAIASENGSYTTYLRAGYGLLAFACNFGPTADVNVRWAIASIIDRNTIINNVLGGYGGTVDASYGMAQWTYQLKRREIAAQLTPIAFNLDKANDLLDLSDYKYEADGTTPFDRTKAGPDGSYMRYNSNGEMLVIHHLSASPTVGGAIESETIKNAPLVGMKYEVTHGEFNDLLNNYYYGADMGDDQYFHSFNLAVDFTSVDDKYWSSHSDVANTWMNPTPIIDDEIDRLTEEMRRLDGSETEKYADLWLQYQVRWQQILPQLPLYSNQYYDIYNTVVVDVPTSPYANYDNVICQITKWP
ncbi:MAG: ABC transporter substrate-binding protein [Oscillospiraceae bacterium]|nr:ABC transporter substrate-binding protein [Oscillospiraceae bacterium]